MDIGNSLRRVGRDDITLRALMSRTVKEVYENEVEIRSINFHGTSCVIKLENGIVRSELQLISNDIKKNFQKKAGNAGLHASQELILKFV